MDYINEKNPTDSGACGSCSAGWNVYCYIDPGTYCEPGYTGDADGITYVHDSYSDYSLCNDACGTCAGK